MLKTIVSLSVAAAMLGAATAQPLPAPPTVKYTAQAETTCDPQTFHVYFAKGKSAMNDASLKLLKAAEAKLEGCVVGPVSLQAATTDTLLSDGVQNLASARLDAVATALEAYDLIGTSVNAEIKAPVGTESLPHPTQRRIEVRLSAWPAQTS